MDPHEEHISFFDLYTKKCAEVSVNQVDRITHNLDILEAKSCVYEIGGRQREREQKRDERVLLIQPCLCDYAVEG